MKFLNHNFFFFSWREMVKIDDEETGFKAGLQHILPRVNILSLSFDNSEKKIIFEIILKLIFNVDCFNLTDYDSFYIFLKQNIGREMKSFSFLLTGYK